MGKLQNEPSALLIGTLIVLQDTAARVSGAGLFTRGLVAVTIIVALIYATQSSK